MTKRVTIPAMSQAKGAVVSEFIAVGTLQQNHDAISNYRLRVFNWFIDTKSNVPFHIFVSNFSDHPRQLLMKTAL